jgi:hypothetical protein
MKSTGFNSRILMITLLALCLSFLKVTGLMAPNNPHICQINAPNGILSDFQVVLNSSNLETGMMIPNNMPVLKVSGRIFYVDQTAGDDRNNGTSPEKALKNCPGMDSYSGSLSLQPGDTVYFDSSDTWTVTGIQGILLEGGVTYIGDSWGSGIRAEIMAGTDLESGVVRFQDHATIPTLFRGFNVDANRKVATGIDINHTYSTLMNGATKRVENCDIHHVWSRTSLNQYKYGIIISNYGGPKGYCENVEIINCKVHDISRDIICLYPSDIEGSRIRNITVRGCEVYNSGQDPDYGAGSGICIKGFVVDAYVEYNYIHDVKASGLFINSNETRHYPGIGPENIHLRYNIVGNNTPHGAIKLHDGRHGSDPKDVKIYGNIIYGNPFNLGLVMLKSLGNANSIRVYNNTFYNALIIIDCPTATFPVFEFRNNAVFYSGGPPIIGVDRFTGFSNNMTDKPVFKNPSELPTGFTGTYGVNLAPNKDGLSLPGNSAGIDGGETMMEPYNSSINTVSRPAGNGWDIGAYEQSSYSFQPATERYKIYTTTFDTDENPISEDGKWMHSGLDWAMIRTKNGKAFGTQSGIDSGIARYNDSYAHLSGFPSDQEAYGKVYISKSDPSCYQEVEILLRWTSSAHSTTGYECFARCANDSSSYLQIVRWEGPLGKFTYLADKSGPEYGLRNGDTLKASIIGNLITVYVNGVEKAQVRDNTHKTGNPGIGMFLESKNGKGIGSNMDYGFTSFTARGIR